MKKRQPLLAAHASAQRTVAATSENAVHPPLFSSAWTFFHAAEGGTASIVSSDPHSASAMRSRNFGSSRTGARAVVATTAVVVVVAVAVVVAAAAAVAVVVVVVVAAGALVPVQHFTFRSSVQPLPLPAGSPRHTRTLPSLSCSKLNHAGAPPDDLIFTRFGHWCSCRETNARAVNSKGFVGPTCSISQPDFGYGVGTAVGAEVGDAVGESVGTGVGGGVGARVGAHDGMGVGDCVGAVVGAIVVRGVGLGVGNMVSGGSVVVVIGVGQGVGAVVERGPRLSTACSA